MARKKKDLSGLDQERLKKVMRDVDVADAFDIINKDSKYSYYLAAKRTDHPQSVEQMELSGYEVVNEEHNSGEILPMGTVRNAEGGAIQNQEHVLMRIPREYAEAKRAAIDERAVSKRRALDDQAQEIKERVKFESGDRKSFSFSTPR